MRSERHRAGDKSAAFPETLKRELQQGSKGANVQLDDKLCLCFHVTQRKVLNFIRVERPQRASQLSECFGAGTGCGWCRPFLEQLFHESQDDEPAGDRLPDAADYARRRARYVREGGGTPPPGATPIDDAPPEDQ